MKIDLERHDIEAIAQRTADILRPLLGEQDETDKIFDVEGLAGYLAVTPKWIYTYRRSIPHIKLKGQLRFRKSEIDAWMNKNRVPASGPFPGKLKAV